MKYKVYLHSSYNGRSMFWLKSSFKLVYLINSYMKQNITTQCMIVCGGSHFSVACETLVKRSPL